LKGVAAVISGLKNCRVSPDFRFRNSATGGENANDLAIRLADLDFSAYVETCERPRCAGTCDHFVSAWFKLSPLEHLNVAADGHSSLFNSSQRHIGVGAGAAFGQINHHKQFCRDKRTFCPLEYAG